MDTLPAWRITFRATSREGGTLTWQYVQGTEPTPDEIDRYKAMTGLDQPGCQVIIQQVTGRFNSLYSAQRRPPMSHDARPFLDTIRAHPDDDGPRLVYADWLEERGECALAELIRVACELEAMGPRRDAAARRVGELEQAVAKAMPDLGGNAPALTWRRGLVIELSAEWRAWLAHGDAITCRHPVVAVQFSGGEFSPGVTLGGVAELKNRWPGVAFSWRHATADDFRRITGDRLYEAMREQPVRPGDTLDWLPMWRGEDDRGGEGGPASG